MDFSHLFTTFVIVLIIAGIVTYLVNREDQILKNEKNSGIDRRFYQLKNKSKKLSERCHKENITGLSFTTLSTVSDELISLLKNNKSYLDSRNVNKFLHSNINIYLDFLEEYESVFGYFDEAKRNKTEEGILDMIVAVKGVSQSIIDERFLGIDVKASVIREISD